jgi:hypothetical protein
LCDNGTCNNRYNHVDGNCVLVAVQTFCAHGHVVHEIARPEWLACARQRPDVFEQNSTRLASFEWPESDLKSVICEFFFLEFLLLVGELFEKCGNSFRLWLGPQLLYASKDPKDVEVGKQNY